VPSPERGFNVNRVEVGPTLAAPLDSNQAHLAQLTNVGVGALASSTHVLSQTILARKAFIHFTGVFEQHSVGKLGSNGYFFAFQDEIGYAGPTTLRGDVCAKEAQVAVFKSFGFPQALHKFRMDCAPKTL
jgi:hypothetical protein